MCGRFLLTTPAHILHAVFDTEEPSHILPPRYNIAPTQPITVVGLKADGITRGLAQLRWGLLPSWANGVNQLPQPINARDDSFTKPMFRECFQSKRCLIPADGFYEWLKSGRSKIPQHIRLKNEDVFAFAGLWNFWTDGTSKRTTCCVVTTNANELLRPIHERMPVILPREHYAEWLDSSTPLARIRELMQPFPASEMLVRPLGPTVNNARNDSPECLAGLRD